MLSNFNLSSLDQTVNVLRGIASHRAQKSPYRWESLYYELFAKYIENALRARERGQKVVTQSDIVPCELVYAMDMVPFHISAISCTMAAATRTQEGLLSSAKSFGLPPEVCSVHRLAAAVFLSRWAPPVDAVLWSNESCDNNAKSAELVSHLYQAPGFYLDSPYYFGERYFDFFAGELQEMFSFLGRVSGRPLNMDRLEEVLRLSQRAIELNQEINQMRRAIPYPANGRLGMEIFLIRWCYAGRPEAVQFLEVVRDELKARVSQPLPRERFRFLSLFLIPNHGWGLLDWMERQHSAYVVTEPVFHSFGPIRWDFARPFHTLAQRCLAEPVAYLTFSPVERWVQAVTEDAEAFAADGAIFWAHTGCRQANATIRTVKDALQRLGVPCLVLDVDTNDPSFVGDAELQDRIEGFLELVESQR